MNSKFFLIIPALLLLASLTSSVTIRDVAITNNEIQPGEKTEIDLALKNSLNDKAEDVSIILDLANLPFAPYESSNMFSFDEIDEDDTKHVGFNIIAFSDATAGTYKIPAKISYTLNNERKETSGIISLIVYASPKLDILAEDSLVRGRTGNLRIKIINSGLGDAKFFNLKIENARGIKIIGETSAYIGNLESDDFDTAEFKVEISDNVGIISLPLELTYLDSRNKQITEEKTLNLKAYTEDEAIRLGIIEKSRVGLYAFLIILLVVLYLVYRYLRKRRKRKSEEE